MSTKSVFFTGLTSGIGNVAARRFARDGYRIYGVSRESGRLETLKADLEDAGAAGFRGWVADLGDAGALEALGGTLRSEIPELDALVFAAGIGERSPLEETSLALWDRTYRVNVTAAFWLVRALVPALVRRAPSSVVFVSSIAGRRRSATLGAPYSSSKAALLGLSRHLAAELGPRGIRVNAVAPSQTLTPLLEAAMTPDERTALAGRIPLRRLALPEDVAECIHFLSGDGARYVSGACLDIHGGQ